MHPWEREYRKQQLITVDPEPQACVRALIRQLKKRDFPFTQAHVLDLGTGTGRNAMALTERGAHVVGYDISPTAIRMAQYRSRHLSSEPDFFVRSIGRPYPLEDNTVDLVLDVTSSNALLSKERRTYISEVQRILKPGGYLFVRTLAKEGDANVKRLLLSHPGPEDDTYIMPGTQLTERVITKKDLVDSFPQLDTVSLKKTSGYASVGKRPYKRQYWIGLFQKKCNPQ